MDEAFSWIDRMLAEWVTHASASSVDNLNIYVGRTGREHLLFYFVSINSFRAHKNIKLTFNNAQVGLIEEGSLDSNLTTWLF